MKNLLSVCVVAIATFASSSAFAQEPAEEPSNPVATGLYGTGIAFLVAPYPLWAVTATIGVTSGREEMAWLYLPVAGPFIAAREADVSTGAAAAMIATGIINTVGFGFLIAAPFVDASDDVQTAITVSPSVSPTGASLTVGVSF